MQESLVLIASFAVGSIPFGWLIAKLWGIDDLRKVGSTNTGATNVVRTAGWGPGALTFLLDFAKGLGAVLYTTYLAESGAAVHPQAAVWAGFLAVLGHCFSPFLRFNGGKGVSTTFGALLALNAWLGGAGLVVYALGLFILRVSAMGSLFAMFSSVAGAMIFLNSNNDKVAVFAMAFVVLFRHDENWKKLLTTMVALICVCLPTSPQAHAQITDFRGKKIELDTPASERIVALIPSVAETIDELGAGKKLVGIPEYSKLNDSSAKVLGPYNNLSAESIYALHPDLVIGSIDGNDAKLVEKLEKLGLRVFVVNSRSLSDIARSMKIVATLIGAAEHPKLKQLEKAFSISAPKPGKTTPKVFVQVGLQPLVSIGNPTFIHELVTLAGGENILGLSRMSYPRPNPEEIVAKNPDVILICQLVSDETEAKKSRAFWMRFKNITAVSKNRVHIIPGDWITKPSFALLRGLEELKKIL